MGPEARPGRPPVAAVDVAAGDTSEQQRIDASGSTTLRWRQVSIIECDVVLTDIAAVEFDGGRLIDSVVPDPAVDEWAAGDSTWRNTRVTGGRIGSLTLARARLDGVALSQTRIGYLDLRGAGTTGLTVAGCRIDTLDVTDARITRATFRECQIGEILTHHAQLGEFDLRGAQLGRIEGASGLRGTTIDSGQLLALAPLLAEALGVTVTDDPE